jgi:Transglutaminase-like superfamily
MRAALLLLSTLVAVGAQSATTLRIRQLMTPEQRVDCPSPWCAQQPALYRLAASSDPSQYLGDVISYERPSDWRDYPPLRDTVEQLTAGLTSDLDKVVAIANWIKHTKVPAAHVYTSWPPSIIDIFGFTEARCEEASFLLTAMLRAAGIPAERFTTWSGGHAAVRAWVDGNWIVADATPTTPDNSGPARIVAADDPSVIAAFQERPLLSMENVQLPDSTSTVDSFTLFAYEPIDESAKLQALGLAYGRVAFPVTSAFLYYDSATHTLSDSGTEQQRVTIMFHIDALDGSCLDQRGSHYAEPLDYIVPGMRWRTIDSTLPPGVGLAYPTGYVQTSLPTCGTWRINYYFTNGDLDAPGSTLAYADFDLRGATDFAVVRPASLQPAPGADAYYFQQLVDALSALPTFEQLGGSTGE